MSNTESLQATTQPCHFVNRKEIDTALMDNPYQFNSFFNIAGCYITVEVQNLSLDLNGAAFESLVTKRDFVLEARRKDLAADTVIIIEVAPDLSTLS
jgi:hypothetical protein